MPDANPYAAPSPDADRALPADSAALDSGAARDAESDALITFGRRVSRVHGIASGLGIVSALGAGVPGYWASHEYFTPGVEGWGVALFNGAVGFGIPGFILVTLARLIANGYVAARKNAWVDELADTHGVSAESMRELAEAVTSR